MENKLYTASFFYRDSNNRLIEERKVINSNSLKDAKITAKNIAQQQDWRLVEVWLP